MKKITEEQFKRTEFKHYAGKSSKLFVELRALEVGEHLFLGREEWKLSSDPTNHISNSCHRLKGALEGMRFSIKQLADDSGWIITKKVNMDDVPEANTGYRCSLCKEMFEARKNARQHLVLTHKGEFGRVMYLKAGKREPSKSWLKYLQGK